MVETPEKDASAAPDAGPRPNEIDPELISLSLPRRTVGPILSLSVITFCVFIMIRLSPDFHFSRQGESPKKITEIDQLLRGDGVADNDFVALRAVPDYSTVFRVARGEADYGHRVAPVVGTNGKLWLMVLATQWTIDPAYSDVCLGRLRRIAQMPFYDRLQAFVAAQPPAHRVVDVAALQRTLEAGATQISDAFGDQIEIAPTTPVTISETVHDRVQIQAFKYDDYPDEAAWRTALIAAGVMPEGTAPLRDDDQMTVYEVAAPGGLADIKAKLITAKLFRARAETVVRHHDLPWSGLAIGDSGLTVNGATVPWQNISSLALVVPRTLRSDALVLMTAERPGTYWYILPVYAVLLLFILLFAWALVRFWRRDRPASAQTAAVPSDSTPS